MQPHKLTLALLLTLGVSAYADQPKATLMDNYNIKYNELPKSVDNFLDAFSEGKVYGHLRSNFFRWDYSHKPEDHTALGLGGSLIYKTAPLYNLSATVGFYYTNSPFKSIRGEDKKDDVKIIRSGKDTFSRSKVIEDGSWDMSVLAQAYLEYNLYKTSIKYGRQLFESALTASNDTKMIPNTFYGVSIESNDVPDTNIKLAYFTTQKLRDHTTFHDVITFGDGSASTSTNNPEWNGNDDNGAHKGLSYANFKNAGESVDHDLIVAAISNKSIKNLKADFTYTEVPNVLSSIVAELNYKIPLTSDSSLTPGFRYIEQFDNGGGEVGGAALSGKLAGKTTNLGYKDNNSLDARAYMARLVYNSGGLQLLAGYSQIADKADIVAPWRGFPTGGYTRAMAQLNWIANTKSYMGEVSYDFGKAKIIDGFKVMGRYVIQDFDESKQVAGVQADSKVVHIDLIKKITDNFEARARFAQANFKDKLTTTDKDSYLEYRFELNYMF